MYVENRTKIANFHTPVYLTPPLNGFPWNFVSAQGSQKTRVMGLSDGRKSFPIGLAVLIQYRSVTDSHPATQPRRCSYYAQRKASSLKTTAVNDVSEKYRRFQWARHRILCDNWCRTVQSHANGEKQSAPRHSMSNIAVMTMTVMIR